MHLHRLRGRKICDQLLRRGSRWKGKTMVIVYRLGLPLVKGVATSLAPGVYAGLLTSSKLSKKATERNRMRRRCREALRTSLRSLEEFPSVQLLLCPKIASLHCDFTEILGDVQTFLHGLTPTFSHGRH